MSSRLSPFHKSAVIPAALFFVAAFFVSLGLSGTDAKGAFFIAAVAAISAAAALFVLRKELSLAFSLLFVLLILARLFFFDTETSDYTDFLRPWVGHMRSSGHFAALSGSFSNYNVPYLVFLALFSFTDFCELYLIKLLSLIFDIALAAAVCRLVGLFGVSRRRKGLAAVLTLALPTLFINGSVWGQCDSIYVFWAVLSVYLCLSRRPFLSVAALALAFSFKLQAVFIMPVFVLFLISGRLRLRHLPVFPAVYLISVSPALIAGRSFGDVMLFYVKNASTVGGALNYNSPSMYSLLYFYRVQDAQAAARAGIAAAFILCLIVFALFALRSRHIDRTALIFAALLFCAAVPLLLPHMHERYFILCDLLCLAAALIFPPLAPLVLLSQFASLLGYYAYFNLRFLLPMRYGFAALLPVALVSALMICRRLFPSRK